MLWKGSLKHTPWSGTICIRNRYTYRNADDIKDRLDKGLLDIGLLTEPVDISKYNFIRLRRKERWGVLVRKDSELARKKSITPEDLLDVPVFLVQRPLVKNELEGWFGDYYDQIHVIGTYRYI